MTPIVNGLEEEFAGQVAVEQLDASLPDNVELQAEYGVRGHPSFVILDENGRVIQTFLGPQAEEVLREAMLAASP